MASSLPAASLATDSSQRAGRFDPVPLAYSVEWLTCAFASRSDVVMVAWRVLLKIVYLLTCRVLGLVVLVFRGGLINEYSRAA